MGAPAVRSNRLKPIAKRSTEDLVTDSLRDYVLSGSVAPGARLTEIALAERMQVARATLRTGLHRLASEGIVVQTPYVGWQVVSLDATDVWELWTLRGSLESLAAGLVAQSTDAVAFASFGEAYERLVVACAAGRMATINAADAALHRTLIEAAGHRRLLRQFQLVEQQVQLLIATSNAFASDGPDDIARQHRPLADAIRARDAARAAYEAAHHNEVEGKRLLACLAARRDN